MVSTRRPPDDVAPAGRVAGLTVGACLLVSGLAFLVASWDELTCTPPGATCDDAARRSRAGEARSSLPAVGPAWWRARVRAREEAARAAARPIRVVQGAAIAALAGLTAAIAGATSAPVQRWVTSIASLSPLDFLPTGLPVAAAVVQRGLLLGAITGLRSRRWPCISPSPRRDA